MPAWIAGIQARKDASGDIRVSLIPALHAGMTQLMNSALTGRTHASSKKRTKVRTKTFSSGKRLV